MKNMVLGFLTALARIRLRRLGLFIIGVTGSIGKTSTKEAVWHLLKKKYQVYKSNKSYNTEFGLPLSILEESSGFSSPWLWLKTILGAIGKAFFGSRNMQMLVLEMGMDKPGDMGQLLKLVRPQVGVITNIRPVHLAKGQFKDLDDIFAEKSKLATTLPEKGIAILNADDPYLIDLREKLICKKIFFGYSDLADLRAVKVESTVESLKFMLEYKGVIAEGEMQILGAYQIYVVMAAVAVGLSQGFELQEAVTALQDYRLPPGRMNPIAGIHDSLIIDSSYNASPEAVKEALEILKTAKGRKIAVLGNMNELGTYTEVKHREIGAMVLGRADVLFTVGENGKLIAEQAGLTGFDKRSIFVFDNAPDAAEALKSFIKKGDTILVKGSQNKVRLEKLVKIIMKEPERAGELLVRQERSWGNKE